MNEWHAVPSKRLFSNNRALVNIISLKGSSFLFKITWNSWIITWFGKYDLVLMLDVPTP